MIQTIIHYSLHFIAPALLAYIFFPKSYWKKAYLYMLLSMLVDADHLLADPIFDPNRNSIGFHPLHSYIAISIYIILCFLPYKRWNIPLWIKAVSIALVFHMITDFQDYYLWH